MSHSEENGQEQEEAIYAFSNSAGDAKVGRLKKVKARLKDDLR